MKSICRHLLLVAPALLWTPPGLADSPPSGGTAAMRDVPVIGSGSTIENELAAARLRIRQLEDEVAKLRAAAPGHPRPGDTSSAVVAPEAKDRERKASRTAAAAVEPSSCAVCPELVELPRGSYRRGSPPDEAGRRSNEGPVRTVTIGYRLAVGKYAVSFSEWDACRADGGCKADPEKDHGGGRHPVINVSHTEVTEEYIPWLNRKAGFKPDDPYRYRLPSEAEREYAARGVTRADAPHPPFPQIPGARFADGRCLHTDDANYDGNYDYNLCGAKTGIFRRETLPVDSLRPNNFGLHHMAGNVWEWVADCYVANYDEAKTDGSAHNPSPSPCKSGQRVARGGAYGFFPANLRAAFRLGYAPGDGDFIVGFRLARTLPP